MAAVVDIRVIGDKRLARKLKRLDGAVQRDIVRKALRKAARPVLQEAQALAPVKTGTLQSSLIIRAFRGRGRAVGVVVQTRNREFFGIAPDDPYFYPAVVEYRHKSYLRAAVDTRRAEFFRLSRSEVAAGIVREARKR